jgi:HPt (histidine-containing phosphotransfer) domain-containing protein
MAFWIAGKGGGRRMSFEEMLKNLQREYLSSLPEKIATIEKMVQKNEGPALRDTFHKLKGTGRTYGLPEVSVLGEAVEEVCIQRPVNAVSAASLAVMILRDIHAKRQHQQEFDVNADPRLESIRKLLQN